MINPPFKERLRELCAKTQALKAPYLTGRAVWDEHIVNIFSATF
jgi:hypothetical protein